MSKRVSGPHFCMGTAKSIAERIYGELLEECDAQGGVLSYDDLKAFAKEFHGGLSNSFPFYEDVYLDCMTTAGGSGKRLLNRKTLPGFVVFAYTSDAIRAAFPAQYARTGKSWAVHFCDALAEYADAVLELPLSNQICKVYVDQAGTRGEHMTIDDIVSAPQVSRLMAGLFEALTITSRGRNIERFCNTVNDYLHHVMMIAGPDPLLVNNKQCREFMTALRDTDHNNRYRHSAQQFEKTLMQAI
ncbi:MAG: hypothetical protein KDJ16_11520 [Hyphomicrobiales bacterium]|nr:hypothetical protein [Hyphomicrobiales bacterium]